MRWLGSLAAVVALGALTAAPADACCVAPTAFLPALAPVAGTGLVGFSGDGGPGTSAQLNYPYGLAVDQAGDVFIADLQNSRVRKVDTNGVITTIAGNGQRGFAGDGGPATAAQLNWPWGVAVDPAGDVFIAEPANGRIRKVTPDGIINTFVQFPGVRDLAMAPGSDVLYFSADDGFVRTVAPDGTVTEVTGHTATDPTPVRILGEALSLDAAGNLYYASGHSTVDRRSPDGLIVTIAGNGDYGSSGDGGPGPQAELEVVQGTTVTRDGSVYLADTSYSSIRKVTPDGIISTALGLGQGPQFPKALASDRWGGVYIAYFGDELVMKLGGPRPQPTQVLTLPSKKTCTSRRAFPIHIRQRPGVFYRTASVTLQGRSVPVYVYTAKKRIKTKLVPAPLLNVKRFRAFVDLRGRVRGTYRVKLAVTTDSGQRLTATRTYHTCSRAGRLSGRLPKL
jgi:streptogramin lyase